MVWLVIVLTLILGPEDQDSDTMIDDILNEEIYVSLRILTVTVVSITVS